MHFALAVLSMALPLVVATDEEVFGKHETSFADPFTALLERRICQSVPVRLYSCEASCGTGYRSCVYDTMCFNPSAGETCCSTGQYCRSGTYCTSGGCCPDGQTCRGNAIGTLPGYQLTPTTTTARATTTRATTTRATIDYTTSSTRTTTFTTPTTSSTRTTTATTATTTSSTSSSTTSTTANTSIVLGSGGGGVIVGPTTGAVTPTTARPTVVNVGGAEELARNTFGGALAAMVVGLLAL